MYFFYHTHKKPSPLDDIKKYIIICGTINRTCTRATVKRKEKLRFVREELREIKKEPEN